MAWHVDETEHFSVREGHVGIAQFDRDAALLFLFEAVGIDAGQRAHQRGLAVVDMSGCADDHGRCVLVSARRATVRLAARRIRLRRLRSCSADRATASCWRDARASDAATHTAWLR